MLGAERLTMRRVVVTGLGLVTPLACGVEETWSRLLAGKSGARPITKFKVDDLPTQDRLRRAARRRHRTAPSIPINGSIPRNSAASMISSSSALAAAKQAVTDSGWEPKTEEERYRTGVLIGSGIGGLARHRGGRDRCCTKKARASSRRSSFRAG